MSKIDFRKKLSFLRKYSDYKVDSNDKEQVNRQFESDRGRIINSAAIRRLQQKTQVFPLEQNAAVRSRLTHSLEVQQIGRFISKTVISQLKKKKLLATYGLAERLDAFESLIEMACLMHDIGNPPFGHFGEAAIKSWFATLLDVEFISARSVGIDQCQIDFLQLKNDPKKDLLRCQLRKDLCQFEGNAQGLRMIHQLLKLNLTYAQIGSILKYTKGAYQLDKIPKNFDYLTKKPGYYWSEDSFVKELYRQLDMKPYCRFPLSYIMEAADDISYCIADLDDAVEKGIFSVDQLLAFLWEGWQETGKKAKGDLFELTVEKAYNSINHNETRRSKQDQFFMYLRVNIISKLASYSAHRFIKNLAEIYTGSFNSALLEDKSDEHRLLEVLKGVAYKRVFTHPEVEQLELQGYRIINGLLNFYRPLLLMPRADFSQLYQDKYHKKYFIETRLLHKLSTKHCLAYGEAIERISTTDESEKDILEFYYRARLIQDYISGMTDHYAYQEYRKFMVKN